VLHLTRRTPMGPLTSRAEQARSGLTLAACGTIDKTPQPHDLGKSRACGDLRIHPVGTDDLTRCAGTFPATNSKASDKTCGRAITGSSRQLAFRPDGKMALCDPRASWLYPLTIIAASILVKTDWRGPPPLIALIHLSLLSLNLQPVHIVLPRFHQTCKREPQIVLDPCLCPRWTVLYRYS
jgi:hypothetical protein